MAKRESEKSTPVERVRPPSTRLCNPHVILPTPRNHAQSPGTAGALSMSLAEFLLMAAAAMSRPISITATPRTTSCQLCSNYWQLIEWLLAGDTHVHITQIPSPDGDGWHDSFVTNHIISQMVRKSARPAKTFSVVSDSDVHPSIQRTVHKTSPHGVIVIVDSVRTLHSRVCGYPPRLQPFQMASCNYVIIMAESFATTTPVSDRHMADLVLRALWKNARIRKAFVLFVSDHVDQHLIGSYDPFAPPVEPNDWGAISWMSAHSINTSSNNGAMIQSDPLNLRGYPLRISVFRRYPTLIEIDELPRTFVHSYMATSMRQNAAGLGGFDAMIIGNLVQRIDATMVPVESASYGVRLANGTFSGSLGDVLEQRVDLSINGRFVDDYETEDLEFVLPVFADRFCVVCPAAAMIPGWSAIFRCFSAEIWVIVAVGNVLCVGLWWLLKRGGRQLRGERRWPKDGLTVVALDVFWIMMAAPAKMPVYTMERVLIGSYLLVNLIIVGTFQGSMMRFHSNTFYEPELDTLAQLDASGLPIVTASPNLHNLFGSHYSPLMDSLRAKFRISSNSTFKAINRAADVGDMCGVERKTDVQVIIQTMFMQANGHQRVHVVGQCPRSYNIAYIVRRESPYTATLNNYLRQFFEAGLLQKWYERIEEALIAQNRQRPPAETATFAFDLSDLQVAFYMLGCGSLVATAALVVELYVDKRVRCIRREKPELIEFAH